MTAATNPGKYVDFDEYVGLKLEKTRSTIRTTDILTAVAGVGAMTLGYLLLFVILDQWVIPGGFSAGWRLTLLSTLVISVIGWLVYKVGIPSFRTVNGLFAAKAIEKAEPELKSNLLNLVDLKAAGRPINPVIMQAIERQTAVRLQQVDIASVIDHRPLVRTAYLLLAVIVVFCIYAMLSPKKISNSIWRGLVPLTQVPLATVTEIIDVKPGDVSVPVHQPFVDVQVDLAGEIPAQVLLLYSTTDGQQDQPLELRADEDGQPRYRGQLIGDSGQGLVQDITYVIRAGDATSKQYRIHVEQPPYADIESLRIEFPVYMKLPPVEQAHHGAIDTWEGAMVTFNAKTNMPVRSATIQFMDDPQIGPNGEEIPMSVSSGGKHLQAQWTLALRSDGTFPKYYRIHCKTEEDRVTTGHVNYPIVIRPDAAPQVTLVQPDHDIDAPANVTVPLLIQAHDPDFELGYVYLNVEKSGQRILHEQLSEGRVQRLTLKHNLELKRLQAAAGDSFELWVEVHDNRRPRANSRNTPKVKIRVIQTVTQQEADEQLAAQNERLDQKMAEANDDANSDAANPPREGEPKNGPRDQARPDDATARRENQDEQPAQEPQNDQQENAGQKKQTEPGKTAEKGESRDGSGKTAGTKPSKKDAAGKPDEGKNDTNAGDSKESKLPNDGTQDDEIIRRINDRLKQNKPPKTDSSADSAENKPPEQQSKPADPNADTKPESEKQSQSDKSGPSSDEKSSKPETKSPRKNDRPQGDDAGQKSSEDQPSTKPSDSKNGSDPKQSPTKPSTTEEPSGDGKKDDQQSKMKASEKKDSDGSADDKTEDKTQDGKKPGPEAAKNGDGTDQPANMPTKSEPTPNGEKPKPANDSTGDSTKPPKTESPDDGSKQDGTKQGGDKQDQGKSSEKPSDADKTDREKGPGEMKTSDDDSQKNSSESSKQSGAGEKKSDKEKSDNASDQADKASGSKSESNSKKEGEQTKEATESSEDSSNASKPGQKPSDSTKKPQKKDGNGDAAPEKGDTDSAAQQQKQDQNGKSSSTKPNEKSNKSKSDKSPDQSTSDTDQEPSTDAANKSKGSKSAKSAENKSNEKQTPSNEKGEETSESKSDSGEKGDSKNSSGKSGKSGAEDGKQDGGDQQGSKSEGGDSKSSSKNGGEKGGQESGKSDDSSKSSDSDKAANDKSSSKSDSKQGDSKAPDKGKSGKQDSEAGKSDSKNQGKNDSGKSESSQDKKGESGKSESGKSESGKGQGKQSGKGEGSSKPGSGTKGGGKGQSSNQSDGTGEGEPGEGDGVLTPGTDAPATGAGDDANLEYNRQATELILQKLKKDLERGDVDPELLEQLGWTPAELKRFADRLSKALNESKQAEETPESRARQQQFQEMLKNLDLKRSGTQRSGANEPKREVNQIESKRTPAPPAYRQAFEKATKDLARQKPPASKPASK